MKFLTFEQVKAQLRLDDAQANEERSIITTHAGAAEDAVLNVCNRSVTDFYETFGEIPAGIVVGALLLTDDLYNHRCPNANQGVHLLPTFDINVKPYVKLTSNNTEYGKHCNL